MPAFARGALRRAVQASRWLIMPWLPVLAADWDRIGYWARELGRLDRAAAVVEVLDRPEGYLVTAEPDGYDVKPLDDLDVIAI